MSEHRVLRAFQEHGVQYAGGSILVDNPRRVLIDIGTSTITANYQWTGVIDMVGVNNLSLYIKENLSGAAVPALSIVFGLYCDDTFMCYVNASAASVGAGSAGISLISNPLFKAATKLTYTISATYAAPFKMQAYWLPDADMGVALSGNITITTGSMHVSGTCQVCGQVTISGSVGINNWSSMPTTPGGGDSIYSTMQGDFVATPNAGGMTFSIAGLPFTPEYQHFAKIVLIASGLSTNLNFAGATSGFTITNNTATLTSNTITRNFGAGDVLAITLIGPDKAYNDAADMKRVGEINPISQHFLTYKEATTADASTVNFYYDTNGYQHWACQGTYSSTATFTLRYAYTLQDDGTVASSCLYNEVGTAGWLTALSSGTFAYQYADSFGAKYLRVQVVITASATWTHYVKTWY